MALFLNKSCIESLLSKKEWFVLNWMLINEKVHPLLFVYIRVVSLTMDLHFAKYRMIVSTILSEIYVTLFDN